MLASDTPQVYALPVIPQLPKKASKNGSTSISIRFRTKKDVATIRRASKALGVSLNTFVMDEAVKAAQGLLLQIKPRGNREAPAQDLEQSA
jgi:hypothetical protein